MFTHLEQCMDIEHATELLMQFVENSTSDIISVSITPSHFGNTVLTITYKP